MTRVTKCCPLDHARNHLNLKVKRSVYCLELELLALFTNAMRTKLNVLNVFMSLEKEEHLINLVLKKKLQNKIYLQIPVFGKIHIV